MLSLGKKLKSQQVGKSSVTDTVAMTLIETLEANELLKLGYTKKQEERHFHGVISLEECNIEEVSDEEEPPPSKSSKDKKASGPDSRKTPSLVIKITSKVPYKTVLKAHNAVLLKAESLADRAMPFEAYILLLVSLIEIRLISRKKTT